MSKDIDRLALSLISAGHQPQVAQMRFATCTSVDWDNRTMEAKGVSDELPYYDVMLGFGYVDIKPKTGTMCLIGIIEGHSAYTFLINAEEVEEVQVKAENIVINDGENSGVVKIEALTDKLNALEKAINGLKTQLKTWTPVPNDGGTALKGAITAWAAQSITETKVEDIENDKLKH